jgi:hypothetical protein
MARETSTSSCQPGATKSTRAAPQRTPTTKYVGKFEFSMEFGHSFDGIAFFLCNFCPLSLKKNGRNLRFLRLFLCGWGVCARAHKNICRIFYNIYITYIPDRATPPPWTAPGHPPTPPLALGSPGADPTAHFFLPHQHSFHPARRRAHGPAGLPLLF